MRRAAAASIEQLQCFGANSSRRLWTASATMNDTVSPTSLDTLGKIHHAQLHHAAYRVKDPSASIAYYEKYFGFNLLHSYTHEKGSTHYLRIPRDKESFPSASSPESEKALWSNDGSVIELIHEFQEKPDPEFHANNGNVEPYRGYGHIALNTDNVEARSEDLEKNGMKFQKRPSEGRMKTIAFVLDPDNYWIELVNRSQTTEIQEPYNVSQTMLRVKDPKLSIPFYVKFFGMTLLSVKHFSDFSLYFLASLPAGSEEPDLNSDVGYSMMKKMWTPVLELTHNHGTEKDPNFSYHNGNIEPKGFGHIGFLCDDIHKFCEGLKSANVKFVKPPKDKHCYVYDPDHYWVKVVQRGTTDLNLEE